MVARVMVSGQWRPIADVPTILNHGSHDQRTHGRPGRAVGASDFDGGSNMSSTEYDQYYSIRDSSNFGEGGRVSSLDNGDVQIAFDHDDGSTTVMFDLDASEADRVAESLDWATSQDAEAFGDRGPDPSNGLMGWKGQDDIQVGFDDADGISVIDAPSGHRVDLGMEAAAELADAIRTQVAEAEEG